MILSLRVVEDAMSYYKTALNTWQELCADSKTREDEEWFSWLKNEIVLDKASLKELEEYRKEHYES